MSSMNRYTPVPPIQRSRGGSAASSDGGTPTNDPAGTGQDDDNEGESSDEELDVDFDLEGHEYDDVKAEIVRRMTALSDFDAFDNTAAKQHMIYVSAAVTQFATSTESGERMGQDLLRCNFIETFQKMWRQHFNDQLFDVDTLNQDLLYSMVASLQVMWNISDKSTALCERVIKVGLHADMFQYLKSDALSPARLKGQLGNLKTIMVQGQLGTLHNAVQKAKTAREDYRECDAVEVLQPYRDETSSKLQMVSCVALMIQCYLITEDENEKINSDDSVFKLLTILLDRSISGVGYNGVNFAPIEVIEVVNKLAANDSNKQRIVEQGTLPYYVKLMKPDRTEREQSEAASGLWTLAFKCKDSIVNEPDCLDELRRLAKETSSEHVRKTAEGALWILENKQTEEPAKTQLRDTDSDAGGHVFISYQWDSKSTVLKVRDRLRAAGYRVWIDEDDMSGSVLEAMALAVEKAVVVIVCLSQKYKESPSCRTEAEYTFRLRKRIIPLRLQPGYFPDGWLGALSGSKLVFDCSLPSKLEDSVRQLVRELGNTGKLGALDATDAIVPSRAAVTHTVHPSHEKSSPINSWTSTDIQNWLEKHKLQQLTTLLSELDGCSLLEYQSMRQDAPEEFFADLRHNNVSLNDRLQLSRALRDLQ